MLEIYVVEALQEILSQIFHLPITDVQQGDRVLLEEGLMQALTVAILHFDVFVINGLCNDRCCLDGSQEGRALNDYFIKIVVGNVLFQEYR